MSTATGGASYTRSFFDTLHGQVRDSAHQVVPLVRDLLRPERVVDVGCGTGTWLAVWLEHGALDVCGIDGDYVEPELLEIPPERFVAADLTAPLTIQGRYDLALCLEVAEHLPQATAAPLVAALTRLAPAVLFSAAIPLQGGVNHVNEQWPEYWAAHFATHGYVPIDCFRRRIWRNEKVAWFYAQNLLLFADRAYAASHPELARELAASCNPPLSLVHPTCFVMRVWAEHDLAQRPLRQVMAALPSLSRQAIARRLQRLRAQAVP